MPDFSIGVDLGGTNLRIAAVTSDGQLLEKISRATNTPRGPHLVVGEMCDAILHLSAKHGAAGKFLGAGIGFPGLVDMHTGIMCKSANLPGFEGFPVRAEIERRLQANVALENDARAAALGEQWLGAARGIPNVAVITLGTGIGGGIVLNGKIWHGMNGMAGEFGHVTVEPEGVPCGCGNRGCAERYASASALLRMAHEAIATGTAPALAKAAASADFGPQAIYDLAMRGDEPSRQLFHTFGRALGMMLAGAVNVLNLEMYVLGGGVASAWDAFAPTMFKELRERSIVYFATGADDASTNTPARNPGRLERKTIVTRALLGSDAGLFGAARAAVIAG